MLSEFRWNDGKEHLPDIVDAVMRSPGAVESPQRTPSPGKIVGDGKLPQQLCCKTEGGIKGII